MSCNIPEKIGAGLSFNRLLTLTAYPAPDWALSLILRGPSSITLTALPENSQHRFLATAGFTSTWTPGTYAYALRATDGTDVVDIETGQLVVTPDLAGAEDGFDPRSPAQIALEAIEAVIAKRATMDQERYRINNRELYRTPIADLIKLRDMYRLEVRREKLAACGKSQFGATVRVRLI